MKILRAFFLLIFICGGAATNRACDLCGCYTPQPNAMPQTQSELLRPWTRGWYAAGAEQFTRFSTVQIDGMKLLIQPANI